MSSKISYYSKGNSVDGTNFCSGVETLAENLMEDNEEDAVITFPAKGGWAGLRSNAYVMTDENSEAVLPLPIYKIKKIELNIPKMGLVISPMGPLEDFKDKNGNSLEVLDITKYVIPAVEWKTLSRASSDPPDKGKSYYGGIYKDNTFIWEEGANNIPFVSTVYKIGVGIIDGINTDKTPTYIRLLESALYDVGEDYTYKNGDTIATLRKGLLDYPGIFAPSKVEVRDWLFRIEYVPITSSTKMRARKSAKTSLDFFQPFNQRAELNAVGAFGKNMWLTAQKTGVREIAIAKNYTRLADIPPLGALVHHNGKKYRLIANKYVQTNTVYMQVIHTLSENWTSKSKHIAVDQKFRNWSIPQDMLWRNLYWEDFLVVSKTLPSNGVKGSIGVKYLSQIFQSERANDKEINAFFLHTVGRESTWSNRDGEWTTKYGVASPCTAYPLGNSLVFSASMKDNLSAGLKRLKDEDGQIVCEEVFYPKSDGTAEKMTIILSDGIGSGFYKKGKEWTGELTVAESDDARRMYPQMELAIVDDPNMGVSSALNSPVFPLFNETFIVEKDPAEAIKFTYQIHFMEDDPDIVLGEALTAKHPLIHKWTKSRSFYVFLSSSYLRVGDNVIPDDAEFYLNNNEEYFFVSFGENEVEFFILYTTMEFEKKVIAMGDRFCSWGIADEDKRLIVGCNDRENRTLVFSLTHKR